MKKTLLVLICALFALPAYGLESSPPLRELLEHNTLSSLNGPSRQDLAHGQRRDMASLARENALGRDLGLAPSDFFSLEEPAQVAANDEFELRLPEEDLPDADIPLTFNDKVEYFTKYFQNSGRKAFAKWLSRSERFIPLMKEVLKKEGLPEDLVYLAMIESGFSPHAYSVASAVGPWQFISATGKRYALRIDSWIDERRDPLKSTIAAALYLKELYGMFNNDWYLAAAGYNAGENKILRAINMYNTRDFWQISKGSYLKRETKDYVPKLIAAAIIAKEPAKYGFGDVAYLPPVEFDTVNIPSRTDLSLVAQICNVSQATIRELNPELRRWCTPPNYPDYQLKIPKGMKAKFELEYAKINEDKRYTERTLYTKYRAGKKDSLASIAKKFGTTPEAIASLNKIGKNGKVRGRTLTVPVPSASTAAETAEEPGVLAQAKTSSKEFNKYYTVKKGDTLTSLSRKFSVSEKILSAWNNIKGKIALKPGRRIIVAKFQEKDGAMAPVAPAGDSNG